MERETCPICQEKKVLTTHHVLPKRFFNSSSARDFTFRLCRECHNDLEKEIAELGSEKFHEIRYIMKLIVFVINKSRHYQIVNLNNVIAGIIKDARTYFNIT